MVIDKGRGREGEGSVSPVSLFVSLCPFSPFHPGQQLRKSTSCSHTGGTGGHILISEQNIVLDNICIDVKYFSNIGDQGGLWQTIVVTICKISQWEREREREMRGKNLIVGQSGDVYRLQSQGKHHQ